MNSVYLNELHAIFHALMFAMSYKRFYLLSPNRSFNCLSKSLMISRS